MVGQDALKSAQKVGRMGIERGQILFRHEKRSRATADPALEVGVIHEEDVERVIERLWGTDGRELGVEPTVIEILENYLTDERAENSEKLSLRTKTRLRDKQRSNILPPKK